jgi:hypothetical protein
MINLLPQEEKKQIRAARTNVVLLRYSLFSFGAILFLLGTVIVALYYLKTSEELANSAIQDNVAKEGEYAQIKTEADSFKNELSNAKTILDSQVSYAKAALVIAKLLPNGTSLNEITLSEKSFGTPMPLTVNIANEEAAVALLKNFSSSSYFSGVTKGKISVGSGQYPYTMEITVTMSKEAAL